MNTDIKLIALDLDGTLLNSRKELSARNYRALEACAKRGIHIVPATGRLFSAMTPSVRNLPFLHYCIAVNGAEVDDIDKNKTISRIEIPNDEALVILKELASYPGLYDCYIEGTGWMNEDMIALLPDYTIDEIHLELVRSTRKPVINLYDFVKAWGHPVQKSQIHFKSREIRDVYLARLKERFPQYMHTCTYTTNIEINHHDANKGNGIRILCDYLGISTKNAMSFGDGSNDVPMFEAAGVGVAMSNADPDVKEKADIIAPPCDEDGVARILEKYVLG